MTPDIAGSSRHQPGLAALRQRQLGLGAAAPSMHHGAGVAFSGPCPLTVRRPLHLGATRGSLVSN